MRPEYARWLRDFLSGVPDLDRTTTIPGPILPVNHDPLVPPDPPLVQAQRLVAELAEARQAEAELRAETDALQRDYAEVQRRMRDGEPP